MANTCMFCRWIVLIALIITLITGVCCEAVLTPPLNYIWLCIFTLVESLALGFITTIFRREEVCKRYIYINFKLPGQQNQIYFYKLQLLFIVFPNVTQWQICFPFIFCIIINKMLIGYKVLVWRGWKGGVGNLALVLSRWQRAECSNYGHNFGYRQYA